MSRKKKEVLEVKKLYKNQTKHVLDLVGVVFTPGESKEEDALTLGDARRIAHAIKCGLIKEV